MSFELVWSYEKEGLVKKKCRDDCDKNQLTVRPNKKMGKFIKGVSEEKKCCLVEASRKIHNRGEWQGFEGVGLWVKHRR